MRFLLYKVLRRMSPLFCILMLGTSLVQAQTLPFEDSQFPCFPKDVAQRYVKDFKIKTSSFGGVELCKSTSDFKKFLNVLNVIENGQFNTPGTSAFIQGFIDSSQYYKWAKMQIMKVERDHDDPTALAVNVRGNIYTQDYYYKISMLERVGTLLHESRHTTYHPHTLCQSGPYKDLSVNGCDVDFASGGAHSIEMEYYARVSVQGQNFHPMYKAMARLTAMARANFVFNTSPLIKREALLLQTTTGDYWLLDQGRWVQRQPIDSGPQKVAGRLKRTSFGASVFTGSQAYAIELYQRFFPTSLIVDSFSYYKTLINLNTKLSDFEEFDISAKRNIVMITPSNQFASYNFKLGKWNPAQNLNLQVKLTSPFLPDGRQGYFLIDSTAAIHAYDMPTDSFVKTNLNWDFKMQSIAKANGLIYGLRSDKKVFYLNGTQWTETPLPAGVAADQMVSAPLYNVFNIIE